MADEAQDTQRDDELAGLPAEVLAQLTALDDQTPKGSGEPPATGTDEPKPAPEPKPEPKAATAKAEDAPKKEPAKAKADPAPKGDAQPKEPAKADPKGDEPKAGTDDKAKAGKGEGDGETPAPATADWREAIKGANRDDLRKDPTINAIVGELVDRGKSNLKAELLRDLKAEMADDAKRQRLDELAASDPDHPLAQEHLTAKQQREKDAEIASIRDAAHGQTKDGLVAFVASLPEPDREALKAISGKRYDGTWQQGIQAYVGDVVQVLVDCRLAQREDTLRKEYEGRLEAEVEAGVKERLGETNGGEPSPKVTSAGQHGAGKYADLTARDIENMDWREFEANENEIVAALARRAA